MKSGGHLSVLTMIQQEVRYANSRGCSVAVISITGKAFEGSLVCAPPYPADGVELVRKYVLPRRPAEDAHQYLTLSKFVVLYLHPGDWLDLLTDEEAWELAFDEDKGTMVRPKRILGIPCHHDTEA